MKFISQSLVGRVVGPSSGSSCYITTCLEPLLNCQRRFKSSGVAVTLGLTVTEINIKKVQKQDFKNIKNVKRCRDGALQIC